MMPPGKEEASHVYKTATDEELSGNNMKNDCKVFMLGPSASGSTFRGVPTQTQTSQLTMLTVLWIKPSFAYDKFQCGHHKFGVFSFWILFSSAQWAKVIHNKWVNQGYIVGMRNAMVLREQS